MTNDELQSQVISFLRFPLAVAVVVIHATAHEVIMGGVTVLNAESLPVYSNVSYLLEKVIAAVAVPLFFFISGFLFFYKSPQLTLPIYKQKLKSRSKSLLLPYLFWNLIMILFYLAMQSLLPGLMSGRNKLIADYTWNDWLWAFWDTSKINAVSEGNFPFNFPFWFIRDLMVMVVLSPLVYILIRKLRWLLPVALGVLWLLGINTGITGVSIISMFFFSAGACFSICRTNFMAKMQPYLVPSVVLYVLMAAILLCFRGESWAIYVQRLSIIVGIVLAVSLSAHFIANGKWKASLFLAGSSFFIYAYHGMPTAFVLKGLYKVIQPQGELSVFLIYVLTVVIVVLAGLLLYKLIKRYLPALSPILTGSR